METRSEEHTSELQSRRDLVCRLLLEKKKLSRCQRRNTSASPDCDRKNSMPNVRCSECGTVNLVADEICKVCGAELRSTPRTGEDLTPRVFTDYIPPFTFATYFFFLIIRLPPRSTLFPYTTLFR